MHRTDATSTSRPDRTGAGSARGRRALRVLSLPGRSYIGNPYWKHFCEAFDAVNVTVVEPRGGDALRFGFDILHVHFPDHWVTEVSAPKALVAAPAFLGFVALARLLGRKVVWTVHDVEPFKTHRSWLLRPFMALTRALVSGYVFMNASSRRAFHERYPEQKRKPDCIVPHGTFPVPPVSAERRRAARSRLARGADEFVVGYLGDVKPYKCVEALAEIPRRDGAGRPISLVVAGRIDPAMEAAKVEAALAAAGTDRIVRIDRRLDDDELSELIAAVDVVCLPYLLGSNSGFAFLVLAAGGRLVTSSLPMFQDMEAAFGAPWVYCAAADGGSTLAMAVLAAAADGVTEEAVARRDTLLAAYDFVAGARRLVTFYDFRSAPNGRA